MRVTAENREEIKALMGILINLGASEEVVKMIVTALKNGEQMDALVDYLELNPTASEMEILDKALQIRKEI